MANVIRVVGDHGRVWLAAPCGCAAFVEGSDADVGRAVRALILHITDDTPCPPLPPMVAVSDERVVTALTRGPVDPGVRAIVDKLAGE